MIFVWESRELKDVFGDGNMNFDKFKDEHCCNNFCTYYGLQPFSPERCLQNTPTSESSSFQKKTIGFDHAMKGKGRAEPEPDDDNISSSWNGGVPNDFVDIEQKRFNAASTSTAGGYTKGMDLSSTM